MEIENKNYLEEGKKLYWEQGFQCEKAIECLNKAILQNPNCAEIYAEKGNYLRFTG